MYFPLFFPSQVKHWKGVLDGRWKRKTDLASLEDPVEKVLAERMELCYIQGKRKKGGKVGNSLVPILFTEETIKAITVMLEPLGEKHDDDYVFSSGELYLVGWDTLQAVAKTIIGLEKPKLITPTRTRKFMSTMLQLLDMSDAELTWLTNHFGHTKNVHFQWYRREDATVELTKIAKVLTAVDHGETIQNKKIDALG